MYAVLNIETGYFYSESPELRQEAKRLDLKWDHTSMLPRFAKKYATHNAALSRSQRFSDKTGCICAVVRLS